jgi:hypothetical protein
VALFNILAIFCLCHQNSLIYHVSGYGIFVLTGLCVSANLRESIYNHWCADAGWQWQSAVLGPGVTHIHKVFIVREAVLTSHHWIQLILNLRSGRWMKMEAVGTFRMTEISSNPKSLPSCK